jgi:hypothetical protein
MASRFTRTRNGPTGDPEIVMRSEDELMRNFGFTPAEVSAMRSRFGAEENFGTWIIRDASRLQLYFRDNSQALATRAVADHLASGGKLNRNVLRAFTESEVGVEMVSNAVQNSQQARDLLNSTAGREITGNADATRSWIREHRGTMGALTILMLLLGGAGAAVLKGGLVALVGGVGVFVAFPTCGVGVLVAPPPPVPTVYDACMGAVSIANDMLESVPTTSDLAAFTVIVAGPLAVPVNTI